MFYIFLLLIIFVFVYAMFLDKRKKKDISYDLLSEWQDNFEVKNDLIEVFLDKKRYHFKSVFVGLEINNKSDDLIRFTDEYFLEVLNEEDNKWYRLNVDPATDWSKEITMKKKDNYYQNIFIDEYNYLDKCKLRIIKKIKTDEKEYIYELPFSIHTAKMIKIEKNKK